MLRNTTVVSISLSPSIFARLDQLAKAKATTRSELIRDMLVSYTQQKSWDEIFTWGRKTKEAFKLTSEEDIIRLIND